MLLQAFGVGQATINQVEVDLSPSSITIAPKVQQATSTPLFGSLGPVVITPDQIPVQPVQIAPAPVQAPVVAPVSPPWSIRLIEADTPVQSLQGMSRIRVAVYDPNGVYQKDLVTVTTNDPDLPQEFTINAPHQIDFFCVAPTYPNFPNNGCVNENPVSVGTFTFNFSIEQGVSTSTQIIVT